MVNEPAHRGGRRVAFHEGDGQFPCLTSRGLESPYRPRQADTPDRDSEAEPLALTPGELTFPSGRANRSALCITEAAWCARLRIKIRPRAWHRVIAKPIASSAVSAMPWRCGRDRNSP